jgi:hypothetical protein
MERITLQRMFMYLKTDNILTLQQRGFLTRRSAASNIPDSLNDWTLAVVNRNSVTVVDYSKAFDAGVVTGPHYCSSTYHRRPTLWTQAIYCGDFDSPTVNLVQHSTGLARTWCVARSQFASDRKSQRASFVSMAFHKDLCSDCCCSHCTFLRSQKSSARSGVNHAQFADDKQLHIALKDDNFTSRLSECFRAVQHRLDLNGLFMNPDKIEAIVSRN